MTTTPTKPIRVFLPPAKPATPKPTPITERPAVLVVVNPDSFVEVFASPGVRVHVAETLKVEPSEEVLAEQYLEMTLPLWARALFYPNRRVATLMPHPRTAAEEYWRRTELGILDILGRLESQPTPIRARAVKGKS